MGCSLQVTPENEDISSPDGSSKEKQGEEKRGGEGCIPKLSVPPWGRVHFAAMFTANGPGWPAGRNELVFSLLQAEVQTQAGPHQHQGESKQ